MAAGCGSWSEGRAPQRATDAPAVSPPHTVLTHRDLVCLVRVTGREHPAVTVVAAEQHMPRGEAGEQHTLDVGICPVSEGAEHAWLAQLGCWRRRGETGCRDGSTRW